MGVRSETIHKTPKSRNPVDSFIKKIQSKLKYYCEFWAICPYFDVESSYCSNAGGSHCGKYRKYKQEASAN